jgi:hypothetical protein
MSNDGDGVKAATYHSSYVELRFERSSLENARNPPVYLRIFSLRTPKFRANLSGKCTVYFLTAP